MSDLDDDAIRWMLAEKRRSARAITAIGVVAGLVAIALFAIAAAIDAQLYDTLVLRLRLIGAILAVIGAALASVGAVSLARVRREGRTLFPGVPAAIARMRRT